MILVFQGSQKRPVRVPISHKGLAQFLENYFFVNPGIFSCYLIKNLDLGSQCWVLRVVCGLGPSHGPVLTKLRLVTNRFKLLTPTIYA